jgi:hypothetical protein
MVGGSASRAYTYPHAAAGRPKAGRDPLPTPILSVKHMFSQLKTLLNF